MPGTEARYSTSTTSSVMLQMCVYRSCTGQSLSLWSCPAGLASTVTQGLRWHLVVIISTPDHVCFSDIALNRNRLLR